MQKVFFILLCILLFLTGCQSGMETGNISFTDSLGNEVVLSSAERVISLYGSYAEAWLTAGGSLVGITEDAVKERNLILPTGVEIVGSVKTPDTERIAALNPDFVILSADIAAHLPLSQMLTNMQIPHAYFRLDTYKDYLSMMRCFCDITGREDLYRQYGEGVEQQIEEVLSAASQQEKRPSVLLIRAYGGGAKAKGADNLAGVILRDLGADNLADREPSLLEELSMEVILREDPEFIFVTVMGSDEKEALAALEAEFQKNPAWSSLKAFRNNRYIVLPKELFHYKPNEKWGESYVYLYKLLYET